MSLTDWVGGSESKSKTFLDKNQLPYLQDMWSRAMDLSNSGASPVAELSPQMQQYIQGAMNFGGNAGAMSGQAWQQGSNAFNLGNAGQDYLNTILGNGGFQAPLQNGVNMNTVAQGINNDVINSQITAGTRDIYRNLNENALPGIAAGASMTGNSGSSRRGIAEGIAMRGANDAATDYAASVRNNAFNTAYNTAANQASQNQSAQLNTNSMNANLGQNAFNSGMGMGFNGLDTGYSIGAGGMDVMGTGANAMQMYLQDLALAPWQRLQLMQGIVGPAINQSTSTSSSTGGILPAVGSALEGAANAKNAFPSDARLKQNVKPVEGETLGGFQLYTWDWKPEAEIFGLSGSDRGVIAQEVAAQRPEAVVTDKTGYLKVDYSQLH